MALKKESAGLFEEYGIEVHYCGIGKVNAAYTTLKLIHQGAKQILNLGTAGSHRFKSKTIVECIGFSERDLDLSIIGFPPSALLSANTLKLGYAQGFCGTADRFEMARPNDLADIVDMEGYAMAKVCKREDIEFHSYKYVTDGTNSKGVEDWKQNLFFAPDALLKVYMQFTKAAK